MNQDWTYLGKRGEQEISGVKMSDLYEIILARIEYYRHDKSDSDAFCQSICCEVEKVMGIYPNIHNFREE